LALQKLSQAMGNGMAELIEFAAGLVFTDAMLSAGIPSFLNGSRGMRNDKLLKEPGITRNTLT
jgi:hypothetical protein